MHLLKSQCMYISFRPRSSLIHALTWCIVSSVRYLTYQKHFNIGKIKTFGYFKVDNPLMSVIPLHIQTVSNSPNQVHVRAYITLVSIIKTPRVIIDRFDELFIRIWTLEGVVTERGAAITIWRLKPIDRSNRFNDGRSHYNMAFYCQWSIKSFTEISVSLASTSIF